jgi:hypothetical protein
MASDPVQPLSTEQAKERLRAATGEVGVQAWVHHNPWGFLSLMLASGYLAGRLPVVRKSMLWLVGRAILTLSNK